MEKKILWISLVTIISLIPIILDILFLIKYDCESVMAFYFVFLTLFSNLLLKNKLYRHHYISIVIIVLLDLLICIIFEESIIIELKKKYYIYLIKILYILFLCLEFVLYKYLMLIKYIQSYEILFFKGLFLSVLLIITVIILININPNIYLEFWYYYKSIDLKEIIIFISLIVISFIYNLIQLIIIYYFTPFHILLTNLIPPMIILLLPIGSTGIIITLNIFLIIYFFMILVFVEFIELNFLGLSKMTKRNIDLRAEHESMEYNINDIIIDDNISLGGYELKLINEQMIDENSVTNE